MRRRKLYRGLAVAFSAILLATSNPATLQNVAAKGIHLQKKAKAKMILEDPTENGAYTLSMTINKEGTSEESMLSGFIDPKIKVTVQDGKTWVTILSTTYADMMYDITLGDSEGNYKISEKTPVGEKNSAGTYNMYEYKIQINKLSDVAKIAVLAEPMGGSRDNIGNYEKYTKADIEDMSIERGWTGFDAIKDQDQKPTGKEALNQALIDYGLDKNNDGTVTKEEIQQYKGDKMELQNCNLSNEGLELLKYLPESVTTLNLSYNNITELPSDLLMMMPQLENFYMENSKLTSIPKGFFKNNTKLNWIALDGNEITTLEDGTFKGLDQLTILGLENNKISKVDKNAFEGMKKIEQLSLYGNNLTTLEDGSLKPLAGSLKMLFLQENNMESLPKAVEDCSSLTELHAWDNGMNDISKVDFSKLPELTELNLMHNEITQIPENAFAKNTKLDGLDLFDNDLTSVSPDILPNGVSLRKLDLKFNNMQIIDKKLINKSQSYNKFYPQKSAMELRLEKSGDQEMKWSQQLSALDLMFWYEETNDAKKKELQSVDEYKEYLKEQGYAEGDFTKTLKDLSYQWDIVTKIQKKDTNGGFVTIDQRINEGKVDEMDGSFKFTEDGTYRVVKDVYGYMSSMRNFLFEAKSNEVTIENKKEDKKEDKTTATTPTSQITTIKKKEIQIAKPSRVVKLKIKKSSKRSVKISWKKQKNASGYEVYRSTKKNKSFKKITTLKKAGKVIYVNKKLKKGKTYYYKVRAYKVVSGKKVYGKFSTIKKIKIKK